MCRAAICSIRRLCEAEIRSASCFAGSVAAWHVRRASPNLAPSQITGTVTTVLVKAPQLSGRSQSPVRKPILCIQGSNSLVGYLHHWQLPIPQASVAERPVALPPALARERRYAVVFSSFTL